jgi:hypothetical protein
MESGWLLHMFPNIVVIHVQRRNYVHVDDDSIKLTVDRSYFPKGDIYTVASLIIEDFDEKLLDQLDKLQADATALDLVPAKSKITAYIARYEPEVYKRLCADNVLLSDYKKVLPLDFLFSKIHPQAKKVSAGQEMMEIEKLTAIDTLPLEDEDD